MSFEQKKFVQKLSINQGKITQIVKNDGKKSGKPALFVEFETSEGITSMRFNAPLNKYDWFSCSKLFSACGVAKTYKEVEAAPLGDIVAGLEKLVGTEAAVLTSPVELQGGKTFWSVKDIWEAKYNTFNGNDSVFDQGDKDPFAADSKTDDIPF